MIALPLFIAGCGCLLLAAIGKYLDKPEEEIIVREKKNRDSHMQELALRKTQLALARKAGLMAKRDSLARK